MAETPALPALYMYPLNGSFAPKRISLAGGERVHFGRFCGTARTTPTRTNGRFDSKVLSRQHADVWAEGGKVCALGLSFEAR